MRTAEEEMERVRKILAVQKADQTKAEARKQEHDLWIAAVGAETWSYLIECTWDTTLIQAAQIASGCSRMLVYKTHQNFTIENPDTTKARFIEWIDWQQNLAVIKEPENTAEWFIQLLPSPFRERIAENNQQDFTPKPELFGSWS